MTLAFLYAGQGSQHPGMGRDLYREFPQVRPLFDRTAGGLDIGQLCFEAPAQTLGRTGAAQPCMGAFAAAVTRILYDQGIRPDYAAGLSLGEYGALYGAGVFSAENLLDLLALRADNDPAVVERLVVEIASVDVEDGVVFLLDAITTGPIRDDDVYPGVRVVLQARLATARIKFSVDVNVGAPVVPAPIRTAVPVLLGDERIHVLAYPKSMVVAEKLVTALQRGRASTRWRDFADLFVLVPGALLEAEVIEALRAVASHRGGSLQPLAEVLAGMPKEAQARWATWRARQGAQERVPEDFAAVLDTLDERTRAWILEAAKAGGRGSAPL